MSLLRNYFNKGFSTRTPGYPSLNLLWVVVGCGKAGRAHHKRGGYAERRRTSHPLSGNALSRGVREPNSPRSSDNSPQARVRRAKIALLVDEGMETNAIAKTLSLSAQTVDKRRRRFSLCGVGPD
ncbi:hypothetical protein FEAC_30130 [Ferrimicrobium acidiphilum DSM 19497]|uniref:Uncharacterized protein n=1 Tax=Ferrimicrobium acidiphilum DSM 19497 TaxID=1121877 RepID=A0A0D8FPQ2_9ACTN|nr:hypothetical protein FEAC_30130 [Ferrimicrobium acidiphilum DSM 19497]